MKLLLISLLIFLVSCNAKEERAVKDTFPTNTTSEKFCFVKNLSKVNNEAYATLDFIEYKKKTELDSVNIKGEIIDLPGGYCYANRIVESVKFLFNDNANIIMQTFSYDDEGNYNFNQSIKLTELIERLPTLQENGLANTPFKIAIRNNQIISLTEIYLP